MSIKSNSSNSLDYNELIDNFAKRKVKRPYCLVSGASVIDFAPMHAFLKTDYSLVKMLFMVMC